MSLRQVWVRIRALPGDSPLHEAVREAHQKALERKQLADVDAALDMFKKKER
jgi:hypothetical protein